MNIFAVSEEPNKAAAWLDDRRANQMIRETGQLLSTTINLVDPDHQLSLYKTFSPNHPCRLWAGASLSNFLWLTSYHIFLLRRAKLGTHLKAKTVNRGIVTWLYNARPNPLPTVEWNGFVNCAGNESKGISFKDVPDTVSAYRQYLNARWATDSRPPTWTTGTKPDWYEQQ